MSRQGFDKVRRAGRALPDVTEGTTYGSPALKTGGRMLACMAIHSSAEPGSLAVRLPFGERERLMAAAPDRYYLTGHYANYPVVLVRLARVDQPTLQRLLETGRQFVRSGAPVTARASRHPRARARR